MALYDDGNTVSKCEPFLGWGTGYNVYTQASDLVTAQFENTEDYAETYSNRVLGLMQDLTNHLTYNQPENPNFEFTEIPPPNIDIDAHQAPEAPDFDPVEIPDKPVMRGEIQPIVIDGPLLPLDDTVSTPAPSFVFEESPYYSQIIEDLTNKIHDVVYNGGRGLSDDTYASILTLTLTADELEYEKLYNDAENYYAAKNYQAPPGALVARVNMLMRERYRNQQRISSELANKQAEIAHNQEQFYAELTVKLEDLLATDRNKVAERALQVAKDLVTFHYTSVEQSIKIYQSRIEAYKTRWSAEQTKVNAIASANKSLTDTYMADLEAWSKTITSELSIIEQITKVYIAEASGFETAVKAETAKANVLIDEYKANIGQNGQKSALTVEEAKLAFQNALNAYNASTEAIKSMSTVASQVTASALSAFNTSASISAGVNFSNSYGKTQSKSCSNSGQESISVNKNYNYSVGE